MCNYHLPALQLYFVLSIRIALSCLFVITADVNFIGIFDHYYYARVIIVRVPGKPWAPGGPDLPVCPTPGGPGGPLKSATISSICSERN